MFYTVACSLGQGETMDQWWAKPAPESAETPARIGAVAYYRHSAQDRQENSIPLQREQVEKWALENGVEIIKEFADYGVSGLSTDRRNAFNEMFEGWIKTRSDFRLVLVLDVSRWGRFQDIDLSAAYSAECTRHGKQVVYTSMGLPKKNDPFHAILISLERYRAAQYSRELSDKTFRGQARISSQGYRTGGYAPFGLSRLLLSESREPLQVLQHGQRKGIQNQRTTLAPGDPKEVEVVLRIFREFADLGRNEHQIAAGLNGDGIPSPKGSQWRWHGVRRILVDDSYIGTLTYNKTTKRLLSPARRNPRGEWVRTPRAFQGIVPSDLFDRAQAIFRWRKDRGTREHILETLRELHAQEGLLTRARIKSSPGRPSISGMYRHFHSMGNAFGAIFPEACRDVVRAVRAELEKTVALVEEHADFLVLDRSLTLVIIPGVPISRGYESYWVFRPDPRPVIDLTLGVALSAPGATTILGYLALPRLLVRQAAFRLHQGQASLIEFFGHAQLGFIRSLLR
jgi:DNA invertase Pin-like site-specific DNA recombinase